MATININKRTSLQDGNLNINKASFVVNSDDFSTLHCDQCGSVDIIDTIEGYVCRACGIILPYQKLEYHHPYNKEVLQYAILSTTQIGTQKERLHRSHSGKFERLNKLHSIQNNEKAVLIKAKYETSRICDYLGIPESRKESIVTKFKQFRPKIKAGTMYRTPEKLIPLIIYFDCKLNNIALREQDLLEVSKIEKKDFNAFKLKIQEFIPDYKYRDRKESVFNRLYGLMVTYERGVPFYYSCKEFVNKFWPIIKNTKDDVIAGLAASIIALIDTKYDKTKFSVNTICTELGIKPSTIHSQVKKKIFEQFNLPKFDTLVKSRMILREFLERLGLAGDNDEGGQKVHPDIIEIKLKGSVLQTFNFYNTDEYYFYIVHDVYGFPIFIMIQPLQDEFDYSKVLFPLKNMSFELVIWWFAQPKGPPFI